MNMYIKNTYVAILNIRYISHKSTSTIVFRSFVMSDFGCRSLKYASLDDDASEQLVKGNKVVVVGLAKSGLDIARGCTEING